MQLIIKKYTVTQIVRIICSRLSKKCVIGGSLRDMY